jgi:hypothetical protein
VQKTNFDSISEIFDGTHVIINGGISSELYCFDVFYPVARSADTACSVAIFEVIIQAAFAEHMKAF